MNVTNGLVLWNIFRFFSSSDIGRNGIDLVLVFFLCLYICSVALLRCVTWPHHATSNITESSSPRHWLAWHPVSLVIHTTC